MQLIVKFLSTHVLDTEELCLNDGFALRDCISARSGVPANFIAVNINGKRVEDECKLESFWVNNYKDNDSFLEDNKLVEGSFIDVHCSFAGGLKGGKGGFGAALRAASKQKGVKRTTDFGSCRDLSGRRLKQVNDEILLQKWKEAQDRGEEFDVDDKSASGISMWYLKTPNWADPFKETNREKFMRSRIKAVLCADWCRARGLKTTGEKIQGFTGKGVPTGAPNYWGCPRGARCEFAHGEVELRSEDKRREVQETRKRSDAEVMQGRVQSYLDSALYSTSDADMMDAVASGMKQQRQRQQVDVEDKVKCEDEVEDERASKRVRMENSDAVDATVVVPSPSEDISEVCIVFGSYTAEVEAEAEAAAGVVLIKPLQMPVGNVVNPLGVNGIADASDTSAAVSPSASADMITSIFSCPVTAYGTYYYEVQLLTDGLVQIGWAMQQSPLVSQAKALARNPNPNPNTSAPANSDGDYEGSSSSSSSSPPPPLCYMPDAHDGAGDDLYSFSYDGCRQRKWHVTTGCRSSIPISNSSSSSSDCGAFKIDDDSGNNNNNNSSNSSSSSPYGEGLTWRAGDVVGCLLYYIKAEKNAHNPNAGSSTIHHLDSLHMYYSINGIPLGEAFSVCIDHNGTPVMMSNNSSNSNNNSSDTGRHKRSAPCVLYPCVSLESTESVAVHLGQTREGHPRAYSSSGSSSSSSSSRHSGRGYSASNFDYFPGAGTSGAGTSGAGTSGAGTSGAGSGSDSSGNDLPIVTVAHAHAHPCALSLWSMRDPLHLRKPIDAAAHLPATTTQQQEFQPLELSAAEYGTLDALEQLGLEYLKWELDRRGLKASGTLEQRASRLLSVRNLSDEQIPLKLKKKV